MICTTTKTEIKNNVEAATKLQLDFDPMKGWHRKTLQHFAIRAVKDSDEMDDFIGWYSDLLQLSADDSYINDEGERVCLGAYVEAFDTDGNITGGFIDELTVTHFDEVTELYVRISGQYVNAVSIYHRAA